MPAQVHTKSETQLYEVITNCTLLKISLTSLAVTHYVDTCCEVNVSVVYMCHKLSTQIKNSQAVKKGAALCKMASMKKVVKYRWQPRNGCDGRSVTKILMTTI